MSRCLALYLGLHKTVSFRGNPGREIVDMNYRRPKAEFVRQGDYYATDRALRFFRGRSTRRHPVVEFAIYSAPVGGTLLWYSPVDAWDVERGGQFTLGPGDLLIDPPDMAAIFEEVRPTSLQLIAEGLFKLSPPPARVVAREPFVPIKGRD